MSPVYIKGPSKGSRSYGWLVKLHEVGGQAALLDWIKASAWPGASETFETSVAKLVDQGILYRRGDLYLLSDDGLAYLGIAPDAPRRVPPVFVGPSYRPERQDLSAGYKHYVRVMRDGFCADGGAQ